MRLPGNAAVGPRDLPGIYWRGSHSGRTGSKHKKKVIGNMIAMAQIPISSSSLFFFLANQGGQKTEKYNLQEFRFFFCT